MRAVAVAVRKTIESLGRIGVMTRLRCSFVVLCVLLLTSGAIAQIQNGQLTGDITDPSGAAIPNAKVTAKNKATDLTVTLDSSQQGHFVANQLPVGTYSVTVTAPNFKSETHTGLVVNAGSTTHSDFKMQLGSATEVIEVTGNAAIIDTESSQLGTIVTAAQVGSLPLNGRNVYDLIQMAPGAVNVTGVDFENGHSTVVNGLREDFNGFLINGVSNKGLSGGEESTPIVDTVEEFQQLGLNMSAQYGNSAGSTINLVTKGGTNAFHGSAFYYGRNEATDANDFFANQAGVKRPPYRWHQYGGKFGGPIKKDKLFFFAAYEGSKFLTSSITSITKETPEWINAVHQADL